MALLDEHGPDARLLAGGTDLIIRLRDGTIAPQVVVDVKGIAELDDAIASVDGGLRIGALTTMTAIAADDRIRRDHQALAEAAAVVGSVQIRNRATLAGNIANASPAADTVPALLVDGALVTLSRSRAVRGRSQPTSCSSDPVSPPWSAASSSRPSRCRRRASRAARSMSVGRGGAGTTWRR